MQFIRTENLKPGMRLAKPIYNKMGILLYDRDSRLTAPAINSIHNFGLIGIYILEPAEPLPPLSQEDIEFEQNQTIYMFKLRDCLDSIKTGRLPASFHELIDHIIAHYGSLNHQINFTQNLRSSDDFIYKHMINTAILTAMIAHKMNFKRDFQSAMVTAALLYNIGYLYVPKTVLIKGSHMTAGDRDTIQLCLEKGYEDLNAHFDRTQLIDRSMALIEYFIFRKSVKRRITKANQDLIAMSAVLQVADEYDILTAMNIDYAPVSEIIAMQKLQGNPDEYQKTIVDALADCIHIVPAGASVDLSNGQKAIVLVENPNDFMKPLLLRIDNNQLYDLSNPTIARHMQITDIMKTMDNRIAINEDTLKLFVADNRIKATAKRFHDKKMRSGHTQKTAIPESAAVSQATSKAADNKVDSPKEVSKAAGKKADSPKEVSKPAAGAARSTAKTAAPSMEIPPTTKAPRRKLL